MASADRFARGRVAYAEAAAKTKLANEAVAGSEPHLSLVTSIGDKFLEASVYLRDRDALDVGIEWLSHGVECMADWTSSHPNRVPTPITRTHSELLGTRGSALMERYTYWSHELDDLSQAIEDLEAAVAYSDNPTTDPVPDSERSWHHHCLARAVGAKARLTNRPPLFDDAISHHETAVALATQPARRTQYRAALSLALSDRYHRAAWHSRMRQDRADFDRAIEELTAAVADTPADDPDAVGRLSNLGLLLLDRHEIDGSLKDVEAALTVIARAVDEGSDSDAGRILHLAALARALRLRYALTASDDDLNRSICAYRSACSLGASRGDKGTFTPALNWIKWAGERNAWREAADAAELGLRAFTATRTRELRPWFKEVWLREGDGLATEGAYAYARAGDPASAALALEHNRAVVLRERFPNVGEHLDALKAAGRTDLHAAYVEAAGALADISATTAELREAATRLHQVIDQIREALDIESFVDALTLDGVREAARDAPIIYVVGARFGGLAIVIKGEQEPETLMFPELTAQATRKLFAQMRRDVHSRASTPLLRRRAVRHICERLGDIVMAELDGALPDDQPVVVVPAGALALLPLHAACWDSDGSRKYAIESRRWTYAPSAQTLLRSGHAGQVAAIEHALAVADPQPVTATPLAGAAAEVAALRRTLRSRVRVLPGAAATADAVRTGVAESDLVHLACHCRADLREPLQSALLLANDDHLTLADLLELDLRHVTLTILSACQTNVTGSRLPDEATSLAAGLLFAGSAGVIGTMWPVPDDATASLMRRFYETWGRENCTPAEALRSAQRSVLADGGAWTTPYYWGGFAYLGA